MNPTLLLTRFRCLPRWCSRAPLLLAITVVMILSPSLGIAAQAKPKKSATVDDISRTTKDGLKLYFRYYPGSKGKKTVPIILLHAWDQQGRDLEGLAKFLQDPEHEQGGHAVVVPDLRGHGRSTTISSSDDSGKEVKLDPKKMKARDLEAMVVFDMETIKNFLIQKNNDAELNIEQLCIVAVEESCLVGLNWCLQDWNWPQLAGYKQGRDVKAFVLVSPVSSFRGFTARNALRHPIVVGKLSAMIFYGQQDRKAKKGATLIYNRLKKAHKTDFEDKQERMEKLDLFERPLPTTLQGNKLLSAESLHVASQIALFIDLRLDQKSGDYPWAERKSPLSDR
jgi:hypothetical protein